MTDQFTEEDGHELAAYMMRDLAADYDSREDALDATPDDMPEHEFSALCEQNWKGNKSEIMLRYLAKVEAQGSQALKHGFFAALTDALGRLEGDCPASWDNYLRESASERSQ